MGPIVGIELVVEEGRNDFMDKVIRSVSEWQNQGYYVEVQYGGRYAYGSVSGSSNWISTTSYGAFSAMVIARLK